MLVAQFDQEINKFICPYDFNNKKIDFSSFILDPSVLKRIQMDFNGKEMIENKQMNSFKERMVEIYESEKNKEMMMQLYIKGDKDINDQVFKIIGNGEQGEMVN